MSDYGPYLYRMAYSVLHDQKEAEDTTQETFIQVYKSLPEYRSQGFKTWITRICINKAIDCKRRRVRRREEEWESEEVLKHIPSSDEGTLDRVLRQERIQRVVSRINELPDSHREIVTAFYVKEQSYEQIAADQSIAVKTVESRLYRARHWMREHWKGEDWS
ncbi:RNA polymerase sigma factor [Paenibacillus zeisoli]|uniref:RNA polymerase sigma factor n=1 Tax=Paenibacillus zeisoli TaxID=2496267 RepID=UPI001FE9D82C|nr:sigma-70 family RNA polymerase sigma factor [Paenibacillus zeisoli]